MNDRDHSTKTTNTDEGPAVEVSAPGGSGAACCTPSPAVVSVSLNGLTSPRTAESDATGSCCAPTKQPSRLAVIRERLSSVWLLIAVIPLGVLLLDSARVGEVLTIATSALGRTIPFIVIAVSLLAYLKAAGAEGLIADAFKGRETRMIVLAALVGGLAPFCSCQVIPFIAGMLALGVPVSAVMAFWLSSPLIDPGSLIVTAGALGWDFAIGKGVAALFLGLLGGFGVKLVLQGGAFSMPLKHASSGGCSTGACTPGGLGDQQPVWRFWRDSARHAVFRREFVSNGLFLFKWLTLAYLLEALLILYVPASLVAGFVGGEGLWSVILGALVGMPAYLNSYAAPALVSGLVEQGMSIGSAMAFMVAGAISSIPAMTAVWSLVKPQVFAAYLGFGVIGAIVFALLFELTI